MLIVKLISHFHLKNYRAWTLGNEIKIIFIVTVLETLAPPNLIQSIGTNCYMISGTRTLVCTWMGDRSGMSISADSPSDPDETLNRGPLALLLRQQYEFPFGINKVQFFFMSLNCSG